ncbi:MAG TPA: TatD family hydrolase [Spirochaetia bacterium]|nr:TatD family hydrolase [Spirochaetia bacterium]
MKTLYGMVDPHFHGLSLQQKGIDIERVLGEAFTCGMRACMDVGTSDGDIIVRSSLYDRFPAVFLTVGLDPHEAAQDLPLDGRLKKIEDSLAHPKIRAIGEIGLDYHWNYGTHDGQRVLFESQLSLASRYSLPVVIHSRNADADTYAILKSFALPRGGIIHCFSYTYKEAKRYLDLGFFLSFAGNITYPDSLALQDAARRIPLDRILLETDSPYLAPAPVRGKPNDPRNILYTYVFTATLLGIPLSDLVESVGKNFDSVIDTEARTG